MTIGFACAVSGLSDVCRSLLFSVCISFCMITLGCSDREILFAAVASAVLEPAATGAGLADATDGLTVLAALVGVTFGLAADGVEEADGADAFAASAVSVCAAFRTPAVDAGLVDAADDLMVLAALAGAVIGLAAAGVGETGSAEGFAVCLAEESARADGSAPDSVAAGVETSDFAADSAAFRLAAAFDAAVAWGRGRTAGSSLESAAACPAVPSCGASDAGAAAIAGFPVGSAADAALDAALPGDGFRDFAGAGCAAGALSAAAGVPEVFGCCPAVAVAKGFSASVFVCAMAEPSDPLSIAPAEPSDGVSAAAFRFPRPEEFFSLSGASVGSAETGMAGVSFSAEEGLSCVSLRTASGSFFSPLAGAGATGASSEAVSF